VAAHPGGAPGLGLCSSSDIPELKELERYFDSMNSSLGHINGVAPHRIEIIDGALVQLTYMELSACLGAGSGLRNCDRLYHGLPDSLWLSPKGRNCFKEKQSHGRSVLPGTEMKFFT